MDWFGWQASLVLKTSRRCSATLYRERSRGPGRAKKGKGQDRKPLYVEHGFLWPYVEHGFLWPSRILATSPICERAPMGSVIFNGEGDPGHTRKQVWVARGVRLSWTGIAFCSWYKARLVWFWKIKADKLESILAKTTLFSK